MIRRAVFALVAVLGSAGLVGCRGSTPDASLRTEYLGGDPGRGRATIVEYHCGSCHTIPGVRGARGLVGPPLTSIARRTFIAGEVPNTPDNLMRWLRDPQSIERTTAMPRLGLDESKARDVASYLYTLQ